MKIQVDHHRIKHSMIRSEITCQNPEVTSNYSQVTNHMIQTHYMSQVTGCMHNITGHNQIAY